MSAVNPIRAVKPGATVLLTATDKQKQDQIVLAYQRYGRGKAVAMPIQDSWNWKMDAKIPVEDLTHATHWRRLARWLVTASRSRVSSRTQDRVEPGEARTSWPRYRTRHAEVNDRAMSASAVAVGQRPSSMAEYIARRRIPGELRPGRGGRLRHQGGTDPRDRRSEIARRERGPRPGVRRRRRVFRRRDARLAAAADCGRHRRPFLHAVECGLAAGSRHLHRPRRDRRRRARPVGHADPPAAPARPPRRGMGVFAVRGLA